MVIFCQPPPPAVAKDVLPKCFILADAFCDVHSESAEHNRNESVAIATLVTPAREQIYLPASASVSDEVKHFEWHACITFLALLVAWPYIGIYIELTRPDIHSLSKPVAAVVML